MKESIFQMRLKMECHRFGRNVIQKYKCLRTTFFSQKWLHIYTKKDLNFDFDNYEPKRKNFLLNFSFYFQHKIHFYIQFTSLDRLTFKKGDVFSYKAFAHKQKDFPICIDVFKSYLFFIQGTTL